MTLIRYPGAKDAHMFLLNYLPTRGKMDLVEPFAGTSALTFALLESGRLSSAWINDIDPGIIDLWRQVRDCPDMLVARVEAYVPSVDDFYEWQDDCSDGFRKLVMHQISFNGLGAKAGSPIGGREQRSNYSVGCRWSSKNLTKKIRRCSALLRSVSVKLTSNQWDDLEIPSTSFVYADPPYYGQGAGLYVHGTIDHQRLSFFLRSRTRGWLLSYDDCPEIRNMYSFADIRQQRVHSKMSATRITDLIITPRGSDV